MGKLIFFTYFRVNASKYCLLNIKQYNHPLKKNKKIIFVDPGVNDLKTSEEYSHIKELHKLMRKPSKIREYVTIDYPNDMLLEYIIPNFCGMRVFNLRYTLYAKEFIDKSFKNAVKYVKKKKYIFTVQHLYGDIKDFKFRLRQMLSLIRGKYGPVLGIGNLCRIFYPNEYTDEVFAELRRIVPPGTWIHFYGLAKRLIKKYLPELSDRFKISVDSTKWTINKNVPGYNYRVCRSESQDDFFIAYMKDLMPYFDAVEF